MKNEEKQQPIKIKLLTLISYKFLPALTGGEIAHLNFHNHIAEYVDNYVVGSSSNDASNYSLHFKLIPNFKNRVLTYLQFPYLSDVISVIQREKIDVLMCSHPYLGFMAYIAVKMTGIKLISYSHNIESERFRTLNKWWWKILFYYEKWVLSVSKTSFFVTEEDRQWAIKNYRLNEKRTKVSPFGIHMKQAPIKDINYKSILQAKHKLSEDTKILYFIGTFPYEPNNQAVGFILNEINPRLEKSNLKYRIFVIGKNLNEDSQKKIEEADNITYLGFVQNIREILDSADIMLNPMLLGGGIKTKAVEALGNNIKVVSTINGAFGLDRISCEGMLFTSLDNDWEQFTENIHLALDKPNATDPKFYEQYYWGNITKSIVDELKK